MSVPYSQSPMTMATNFFQQQDSARRKTIELVVYFVLAILILIALVYGLFLWLGMDSAGAPVSWWQPELFLLAAAGVGLVVGGASVFKVAQLASGGQAVALMMGGKEIPGTTTDPRQKRLLNVVEEMALAAGVPVPPVYVLEEPGSRLRLGRCRGRRLPGRPQLLDPRRTAGRGGSRVQPHPQRRHAAQHPADRPDLRDHGVVDHRPHPHAHVRRTLVGKR